MLSLLGRVAIGSLVMIPATQVAAGEIGAKASTKIGISDENWVGLNAQTDTAFPAEDQVGSGDKVKVTFVGNADLTGEFRVQGDGTITLPVLGSFSVIGLTTSDIAKLITARFAQDARRSTSN